MECEVDYELQLYLSIIHIFLQDLGLSEHWNCMLNAAQFSVISVKRTL